MQILGKLLAFISVVEIFVVGCNPTITNTTAESSDTQQTSVTGTSVPERNIIIPDTIVNKDDGSLSLSDKGLIMFREKPFSGHAVVYYPDGKVKEDFSYYEGWKEDTAYSYFPDGTRRFKRPFSQGKKHGWHVGWWPNGQMKYKYYFENGLSEGNHLTWFRDGLLFRDQNYKDGREFGRQQVYRSDGKIRSNYIIRENGRKYGLVGLKRCDAVDTDSNTIKW